MKRRRKRSYCDRPSHSLTSLIYAVCCSLLDTYIKAVQNADDAGKAKFAWQMWSLGSKEQCRHLPKIESQKALALLSTFPTAMLVGLEVKRQAARAFSGFTAVLEGRKIVLSGVEGLVAIVQTLLAANDSFTQRYPVLPCWRRWLTVWLTAMRCCASSTSAKRKN